MKIISWLLGLIVALVIGIYVIAFTSLGNAIVAPMLEGKIQEQTKLDSKLKTFSLGISEFEILLDLDTDNSIYAKGTYSLMEQSVDAVYDAKLKKLQSLEPLTNKPLIGSFFTDGTAKGDKAFMKIDGKSDVAMSTTVYHVELTDLNPTSIIAKVQEADLLTLLALGGQKPYADAKVDLDVNFKNIKIHELDGDIVLSTKKGKLNTQLMNEDFELKLPASLKTNFAMNLDAKLKGDAIDYTYALNSNLAQIKSSGNVIPEPLKVDVSYQLDVKELAVLKPITGADIRGALVLDGIAKGSKQRMIVEGTSNIASSKTQFSATLKEFKPSVLNASIEHLKIEKLLYMLKQPHYADGIVSLHIDMTDLRKGHYKGNIISSINKGLLDSKVISRMQEFKAPLPRTAFNLITNTVLHGDMTETKLNLKSTLASLDVNKAKFNIKDQSIESDFKTTIEDLGKLYFVTERQMKGKIISTGMIKKGKDLDLKVHSKVAGGTVEATLFNDKFHADLKSIQTLNALHMLIYPEVFSASLNGTLDYDTKVKQGTFKGDLRNGKFAENQMLTMVK